MNILRRRQKYITLIRVFRNNFTEVALSEELGRNGSCTIDIDGLEWWPEDNPEYQRKVLKRQVLKQ
jgi:hypothetical protein